MSAVALASLAACFWISASLAASTASARSLTVKGAVGQHERRRSRRKSRARAGSSGCGAHGETVKGTALEQENLP